MLKCILSIVNIKAFGERNMDKIKWIHLSDIHYNYNNYESGWLRDKLIDFFKCNKDKYDFMVVTGDLLYQFKDTFEGVKEFLNEVRTAANIENNGIFIVPGNHDFERCEPRSLLIESIMSSKDGIKKKVSELSKGTLDILINGQDIFWKFHKEFLQREDNYKNLHFVNKNDKFNIINLNTCLISGKEVKEKDEKEEGKLSINLTKLREVLKEVKGNDNPNIAIGHHSLECFTNEEQDEIIKMFVDYDVDIYLCGHMHKSKQKIHKEGKREIRSLVCGANMTDSYAEPTFIIGELNLDTQECSVTYYEWANNRKEWIIDNDVDRNVLEDGTLRHKFERLIKIKETNELVDKKIELLTNVEVQQDKFEKFLINFCKSIKEFSDENPMSKVKKDVQDKFRNMKCNSTLENEFNSHVEYFTLIDNILADPSYIPYDKKIIIPGIIISVYADVLDTCANGNIILNKMVNILSVEYIEKIGVPLNDLKQYFRTIIFWSINKCDIYNETK